MLLCYAQVPVLQPCSYPWSRQSYAQQWKWKSTCTAAWLLPLHYMQILYVFFLILYRFLMVRIFLTYLGQNSFFSCPESNEVLSGRKKIRCLITHWIAVVWVTWAEIAWGTTLTFFPSFLCFQLPVPEQDFHSSLSTYYKSIVKESIYAEKGTAAIYSLKEASTLSC